ncbi:Tn3 family transposase [Streptomyces sp. NPDC016172]|uniref:Tn3 family transposase n=1 Tax=Streptomyces sp. NPDC016172 TaxID=3364964 RepID=UPI0036F82E51
MFKTLHLLRFVSDEGYRRMIGAQLDVTDARHRLSRRSSSGREVNCASTISTHRRCPAMTGEAGRKAEGQRGTATVGSAPP